jgi:DNA modification methylase
VDTLLDTVIVGDAYDLFGLLPPESVDLIITSPPYWGHRDYGLDHNWDFFNSIEHVKKVGARSRVIQRTAPMGC